MVAISIIAIMVTIGSVVYSSVQKNARDSRRLGDIDSIVLALETYKAAKGYYPQIAQSGGGPWFCDTSGNFADNAGMITELGPFFIGGAIPKDPINDSTYRYKFDMLKDENRYFLYATFENPPQTFQTLNGWQTGDPQGDACVGPAMQVHILKRN